MKMKQKRVRTSRKLFLNVLGLFSVFALCFFFFQYQREKSFAAERLSYLLENYNDWLYRRIGQEGLTGEVVSDFLRDCPQKELRITVLDRGGEVLYDSEGGREGMENHAMREEIAQAMAKGTGSAVRESASVHKKYFYSAKNFGDYTLRMALPYDRYAQHLLAINKTFIWFMLLVALLMILVIYRYTSSLGKVIRKLRQFAYKAENNLPVDLEHDGFPKDELGEISQHIVGLYRKLEQAKEVKKQLTHNIAHELKTPVSSIRGFLELILTNPEITPLQKQQFLERSYAQTERLSLLLKDISLINSLDEAQGVFETEKVNLNRLIGELVEDCMVETRQKKIGVEVHLPEHCVVEGNYSLLYSIFRNLLDNAIQYAGEGIRVEIDCYLEEEDYYRFVFADSGTGVEGKHLDRIFERFYRVDKGRSRKAGGTGLGLSIVKNAVLFHHGTITAKNGTLGGLEFEFTLRKRR